MNYDLLDQDYIKNTSLDYLPDINGTSMSNSLQKSRSDLDFLSQRQLTTARTSTDKPLKSVRFLQINESKQTLAKAYPFNSQIEGKQLRYAKSTKLILQKFEPKIPKLKETPLLQFRTPEQIIKREEEKKPVKESILQNVYNIGSPFFRKKMSINILGKKEKRKQKYSP